jgi:hypothetical protein
MKQLKENLQTDGENLLFFRVKFYIFFFILGNKKQQQLLLTRISFLHKSHRKNTEQKKQHRNEWNALKFPTVLYCSQFSSHFTNSGDIPAMKYSPQDIHQLAMAKVGI